MKKEIKTITVQQLLTRMRRKNDIRSQLERRARERIPVQLTPDSALCALCCYAGTLVTLFCVLGALGTPEGPLWALFGSLVAATALSCFLRHLGLWWDWALAVGFTVVSLVVLACAALLGLL